MTSSETTSPKTSATVTQDHVGVWASLQVVRKRWDIYEVFKDTGWRSWTIVKGRLVDSLVCSITEVSGKNCSLWVLDMDRKICKSGADSIEIERGVRD